MLPGCRAAMRCWGRCDEDGFSDDGAAGPEPAGPVRVIGWEGLARGDYLGGIKGRLVLALTESPYRRGWGRVGDRGGGCKYHQCHSFGPARRPLTV